MSTDTQRAAMQAALIERLQYWADDAFELQPGEIARMGSPDFHVDSFLAGL